MAGNTLYTLEVLASAIEHAGDRGLVKPQDVSTAILVALDKAGLKIVRKAK